MAAKKSVKETKTVKKSKAKEAVKKVKAEKKITKEKTVKASKKSVKETKTVKKAKKTVETPIVETAAVENIEAKKNHPPTENKANETLARAVIAETLQVKQTASHLKSLKSQPKSMEQLLELTGYKLQGFKKGQEVLATITDKTVMLVPERTTMCKSPTAFNCS